MWWNGSSGIVVVCRKCVSGFNFIDSEISISEVFLKVWF